MNHNDFASTEVADTVLAPGTEKRVRPLKIRRVSMRHGWYWLIEGLMLWIRSPAFLSFMTFSCILGVFVATLLPYIGELLAPILAPGLTLGVFNGCRAIDRKRRLSPGLLFSGFRRYAYDLLLAGFCNFVITTVVLFATWLIDDGVMWRLAHGIPPPEIASNATTWMTFSTTPPVSYSLSITAALFGLWGIVYLFVPQLIGWWKVPVFKALAFSLKGCLVNFLPFFTYVFCFCFFLLALPVFMFDFFNLIMEGFTILACVIYLFIVIPVLFASFYVAARDIYGFPRHRKRRRHVHKTPEVIRGRRPANKAVPLK